MTYISTRFFHAKLTLVAVLYSCSIPGCLEESTTVAGSSRLVEQPSLEAGTAIDLGETEPDEGMMSTTCTSADDALGFEQALRREDFHVVITRNAAIVGEIEVAEDLPNGRLTGTAWEIDLGEPQHVFGEYSEEMVKEARAIVMRHQNTVFQFHGGGRFREAGCGRSTRVEGSGSLGDRVELAQGRSVALLLQRTSEWGWIVRGLTTVSGGALHVNTSDPIPIRQLEEADAIARLARDRGEAGQIPTFEMPPVPTVPPGVCPPGGCDAPL